MAPRIFIWIAMGSAIALGAGSCGGGPPQSGGASASEMVRFFEPDGWWSIEVPAGWRAVRIELDGYRTVLKGWERSASPTPSPSRDTKSDAVYYEFEPIGADRTCAGCPAGSGGRISVAAIPLTDAHALAESSAKALRQAPDTTDVRVSLEPCAASTCPVVTYLTPDLRVRTEIWNVEVQRRTYELRATAKLGDDSLSADLVSASASSFLPGSRTA